MVRSMELYRECGLIDEHPLFLLVATRALSVCVGVSDLSLNPGADLPRLGLDLLKTASEVRCPP